MEKLGVLPKLIVLILGMRGKARPPGSLFRFLPPSHAVESFREVTHGGPLPRSRAGAWLRGNPDSPSRTITPEGRTGRERPASFHAECLSTLTSPHVTEGEDVKKTQLGGHTVVQGTHWEPLVYLIPQKDRCRHPREGARNMLCLWSSGRWCDDKIVIWRFKIPTWIYNSVLKFKWY